MSQRPGVCSNCPVSSLQTHGFAARCRFHGLIWTLRGPPGITKHIMQQALVLRLWQNGLSVKGNRESIRDQALAAAAVLVNMCECIESFQCLQLAQVLVQELLRL